MPLNSIDLNCDMGEAYGVWNMGDADDGLLMKYISSASIAAGFHAGDPNLMDHTVQLALQNGVNIGAHPGYRDLQGFGRRKITGNDHELVNDIIYQVGALREFCKRHGTDLSHVKPHGALYMELAVNKSLSTHLIESLQKIAPNTPLYCMGESETYRVAKELGHPTVREFYADRHYGNSGSIVFTRNVGQLNPTQIAEKVVLACLEGKVMTVEDKLIDIAFESVCFHSDTPGSKEIAISLGEAFKKHNISVKRSID